MTAVPTWVLLRGLTREHAHWGGFADELRARWPGRRVLVPDLPGSGALHAARSPAEVAAMVEALRGQLAAGAGGRIAAPIHLLALSLGAMVALDWAARHPQEIAGCVLVNTSLAGLSPFHRRLRPVNYARLVGVLAGRGGVERREAAILRLTSARPEAHAGVVADWAAIRRARPVSAANALRQLVAALRFRAPRCAPSVPMLVLAGAGDRLVDPRCSADLARAWSLPMAVHPWAGHDLPLDDGAWVVDRVARWLDHVRPVCAGARAARPEFPESSVG